MDKLKNKLLPGIFTISWIAVLALTGNFEQCRISAVEYIVYCTVAFIAIGVSGFMSGLLTLPDSERRKKQMPIDTIRLRALHTKCLSVRQIARAMRLKQSQVEEELKKLGYTPRYDEFKSEPDKLLAEIKKEPASAATDTDSMVESFGKESTDIIPGNISAVKGRYFSDDACEAIVERLNMLYGEVDEISMQMIKKIEAIKKINASIDELDSVACGIQFRIQELEADLVVITGGVVGE